MSDYEWICGEVNCAARVSMTKAQHAHHKEYGTTFYCTAGHARAYRPSELDKLKKKTKKLEQQLKDAEQKAHRHHQWYLQEQENWRCPFAQCGYMVGSKGSMVGHIRRHHRELLLPADAGEDGEGGDVWKVMN